MSSLSSHLHHTEGVVDKPGSIKHDKPKERDRGGSPPPSNHRHPSHTPVAEPGSTTDEPSRGAQEVHHRTPLGGSHHPVHHPHPSFPPIPYLWDPRIDPRLAAMDGRLSYNRPIPVSSRTHEGRYHFEPYMNHPVHGYTPGSSPVMSDVSLIRLSPQRSHLSSIPEYHYPYIPHHGYLDHHHHHGSPAMSVLSHARGLSPTGSHPGPESSSHRAASLYGPQGLPGDLLSQRPSTAGSIEHPALDLGSVEGSRFSSPKPGGRLSRKRGLSISPLSGSFDIDTLIRNSPNSLVAYMNNSRSSSAASGSYGHLSAGTISPLSWHPPLAHLQHLQQQLMRHNRGIFHPSYPPGVMAPPPPGTQYHHHHPPPPPPPSNPAMAHLMARASGGPSQTEEDEVPLKKMDQKTDKEHRPIEPNNNLVSSSVDLECKKKAQEEEAVSSTSHAHDPVHKRAPDMPDEDGHREEVDVPVVTDCEWSMCTRKYSTLEQLVQHINNEHIHNERKEFICRWRDCIREEKPFKAQYMLVVHMRRHTGEKPHKCTFEGCAKAYSRLENLKTHLRSHTGERPYVCEVQGCTKAFSNASDRAKHQNRTHSNAKPYVCKIPGCTKRYTDPSSLRKHVKTVHGPDAHVTKKMRGDKKDPGSSGPKREDRGPGDPGTPIAVKAEHSPVAMKVEVDASTMGQACQQDRMSIVKSDDIPMQSCQTSTMGAPDYSSSPQNNDSGVEVEMNASNGSDDDKIQDDRISSNMGPPTEGGPSGGPITTAPQAGIRCSSPFMVKASRPPKGKVSAVNRLAQKVKNVQPLPQLPPISMKPNPVELRLKDRTVEKLAGSERCDSSQSFIADLENIQGPRRGSNTSTISSYLSSRRSSEASPFPGSLGHNFTSRRSSQASSYYSSRRTSGVSSQFSSHMGMMNSPYDMNSLDSRRSSGASSLYGPTGLPGLTIQDQRRLQVKYDHAVNRQSGWDDRMGPSPSPVPPPMGAGYRRVSGAASLPPRTPLPHEVPGNETRRASDPVKLGYDQNPNLPRYNSLNSVAPLPIPNNMQSLHHPRSMETVVEGSVYQGGYRDSTGTVRGSWGNLTVGQSGDSVDMYHSGMEGGSNQRNVDDLVLPDEMVRYLEDQQQQQQAMHRLGAERGQHTMHQPPVSDMVHREGYPSYRDGPYPPRMGAMNNSDMMPPDGYDPSSQGPLMSPANQNTLRVPSQPMPMEMSPDCNQVTSTVGTDVMDAMARGLANLSEDGMDHVQPLVPDGVTTEMTDATSVSNMVVNDMSSMLTSLAEENKYLHML